MEFFTSRMEDRARDAFKMNYTTGNYRISCQKKLIEKWTVRAGGARSFGGTLKKKKC